MRSFTALLFGFLFFGLSQIYSADCRASKQVKFQRSIQGKQVAIFVYLAKQDNGDFAVCNHLCEVKEVVESKNLPAYIDGIALKIKRGVDKAYGIYKDMPSQPVSRVRANFIPQEIFLGGDYLNQQKIVLPLPAEVSVVDYSILVAHELFHYMGIVH